MIHELRHPPRIAVQIWPSDSMLARHGHELLSVEIRRSPGSDFQGYLKFASQPEWKRIKLCAPNE